MIKKPALFALMMATFIIIALYVSHKSRDFSGTYISNSGVVAKVQLGGPGYLMYKDSKSNNIYFNLPANREFSLASQFRFYVPQEKTEFYGYDVGDEFPSQSNRWRAMYIRSKRKFTLYELGKDPIEFIYAGGVD